MYIVLLFLSIFCLITPTHTRTNYPINASFSGYIKYENWFDSRQVTALHDGEYLLYPQKKVLDALGLDVNAKGQYNASTIQTRTRLDFSTTLIPSINPKAVLECDFWGVGISFPFYRIRHAYIAASKNNFSFLIGHTWHPLFLADCFPETVSFNAGDPIELFSRQPQIRIAYTYSMHEISLSAITHLETASNGPLGSSTTYLRDNVIPNIHLRWLSKNNDGALLTVGCDYLRIIPRLTTNTGEKTHESVTAMRCIVATKMVHKSVILKLKGIYAQNAYDLVMIGGYGVRSIDALHDTRTYIPMQTCSLWGELIIKKTIEPALFVGLSKNLGTGRPIILNNESESLLYTRNSDIDTVIRISPRIRWYIKPLIVACELEYTRASYGTINAYARAINTQSVGNFRWMASLFYTF